MKLFLDSADPKEIASLAATGLVDGVTTNPSLAAKSGQSLFDALRAICDVVKGSVSAEVTATETGRMIEEGRKLAKIADNITVKVPLTWDGLKACRALSSEGFKVNVTLCFSPTQALLAAKGEHIFRPLSGGSMTPAMTAWP
jgi:transaldolase